MNVWIDDVGERLWLKAHFQAEAERFFRLQVFQGSQHARSLLQHTGKHLEEEQMNHHLPELSTEVPAYRGFLAWLKDKEPKWPQMTSEDPLTLKSEHNSKLSP